MNVIHKYLDGGQRTLLGVGPMSKICIEAAALISKKYDVPIQLIASRRQIDSEQFGGGYVEGMTTKQFTDFVRGFKADKLFLARDHGGPWQSPVETKKKLSPEAAMQSSLESFQCDIECGFDFIHIDPSIPINDEHLTTNIILDRVEALYESCCAIAAKEKKLGSLYFELGTEEQSGYGSDLGQMDAFLQRVKALCTKHKWPMPMFIVAQTGTKVMETENIGVFAKGKEEQYRDLIAYIRQVVALCKSHGIYMKEHNADYLNAEVIALRPDLGIHASNVAPEFGVEETKGLLYALRIRNMTREVDDFIQIALESKKWEKWMLKDTQATDFDRAVICGHYVFSNPRVKEIREKLNKIDGSVNAYFARLVQQSMLRYLHLFNAF